MLAPYRKLVAALIGLAVMLAYRWWGVDLVGTEDLITDFVVELGGALITAAAVYWFPNTPRAGP